jgi:hypothetical protein
MKRLALLVLLAACEEPPERFPIVPGGGGSGASGQRADAAVDAPGDASLTIAGRVCVLRVNLRQLDDCATSGAANLLVTLGTSSTTTAADGSFTIMRPAVTTNLVWRVTGVDIEPSAMRLGANALIPAVDSIAYQDMLLTNSATHLDGDGAIMMRVTRAGAPVVGATVEAQPQPGSQIYYDGLSDAAWDTTATGASGVTWIPSMTSGTAQLTVTSNSTDTVVTGVPVFGETITFVFAEIL